jgi:AraC family transcriptional regulator, regulatory protein of adaptative response / methylated-DNA-[protein]-cysteine methyltransferase
MTAAAKALDDARWESVVNRRKNADGLFVYAVRTTGVFCVPSCPSRKPSRANVAYFPTVADARGAGFRACRRCRPDSDGVADAVSDIVVRLCRRLETDAALPDLAALAISTGWSRAHLQRTFTARVGVSPRRYVAAHRLLQAKAILREGSSVTDAVYAAGFGSSRAFYEQASVRLGMPPSTYARGGDAVEVRFSCIELAGDDDDARTLLVAATDRGLCAVRFGSAAAQLVDDLEVELPAAKVVDAGDDLVDVVDAVAAMYAGRPARVDLPLDVRGTAFQAEVWEALRSIPAGETRSYADVAAAVGRPGATRAVGSACGANPVALVVPCHRVLRSNGALGGYRWGLRLKAELLAREGVVASGTSALRRGGPGT